MTDFFTPSVITALTALVLSMVTLFQFIKNLRFQQEQFSKTNNRELTTKLYDLRLEHYPKAFDITDQIIKVKGGNYDVNKNQIAKESLLEWKSGVVNIIISVECRDSYYVLRDSLMKNPAEKGTYSPDQIKNIEKAKRDFRKQLRRDFGFMYREEKERRKKPAGNNMYSA